MVQTPRPSIRTDVSRRTIIAATGSLVAGGGVVAVAGSQRTKAAVTASQLSIPTETAEGSGGEPATITVSASGAFEYATNGADTIRLALDVASAVGEGDWQTIDTDERSASAKSGAGQYSLSGSAFDHGQLEPATFAAKPESTAVTKFPVRVVLDVLRGGETVVSALAEGVAEVEVTNSDINASAALTGDGTVTATV